MITIKDINNAPAILNEKDRNFSFQKIDALKGFARFIQWILYC